LLNALCAPFDRFGLPDPLLRLQGLLEETVAGTRSVIHGDLNLENVLVGPGSLVWMIDFAMTREGHPLYDFAHLESEVIAHILSEQAGTPRAYLDLWRAGENPLLNSLHAIAGRCLLDPLRPREYHLALYMACMGALKYTNLSASAKHCLFLTAADLAGRALKKS
jgi:aminoglycoside phosphotransferase (APT) family kinase protein